MEGDAQKNIRIGITGHRNLTGEQLWCIEPAIKRAIENIKHYAQNIDRSNLPIVFTSAIATGADTLFANIALKYFEGGLDIYLPFEKEEYVKDFNTQQDKEEFERLMREPRVKNIVILNKLSAGNRDDLYLQGGKKVVDDSQYIIAVWNEKKAKGVGGTGDIVAYAISKGKNVLVINPDDKKLIIKANYLPHLAVNLKDQPRPAVYSNNIVNDYFVLFDKVAIDNQAAYKRIWQRCFRIGWLAALILAIKVSFNISEDAQFILTLFEIVCLTIVVILILRERWGSFHKNYLQYRFIAERLRANNLVYQCGYYPIKTVTKVIHKAMQEIESKYPVDLINKVILLTSYTSDSQYQKKAHIRSFAISQANYHKNRKNRLKKENKKNHFIKMACIIGFAAIILLHFLTEFSWKGMLHLNIKGLLNPLLQKPGFWIEFSFMLYLFIPTTLARFEAVKYLNDWERLITQSTYMNEFFTEISKKVEKVQDEKELYNLMVDVNDNIYLENLDWEMFMVNKNEEIT
jgi:hypothetical protein